MSGWNCSRFDVPFLIDRMDVNDVPLGYLSPIGRVDDYHINVGREIKIRGIALIDMLKAYKKMSENELESYKLDFVAHKELGVGKNDISKLPQRLWEERDYDRLLIYNRRDVEILKQLDEKLDIIGFLDKISEIASCDISETLYNSRIVDSYILKHTASKGIILPSKDFTRHSSGYRGATVLDPVKGIHEKVGVFDLASLYPSIIISFNLSPDTLVIREEAGNESSSTSNTVGERSDGIGLIPTLLEDLFVLRKKYKNEGKDNEQRVVKQIMNSFYGVMAFPSFRLYTPQMAEEVTRRGREIIEFTKETVEAQGYKVIYGDTDSVFVANIPDTAHAERLEQILNGNYNDYAHTNNLEEHRFRIEFEKFGTRAILVGKKRYAMKTEGGEYIVKGFQMVRSDAQQKTKDIQEEIIHRILDGATGTDIRNYYLKEKDKILSGGKNSIQGIGIPRKFTKSLEDYANNTAVKSAQYSNKYLGKSFGAGDKVIYYHIKYAPVGINDPKGAKMVKAPDAIALEYGEDIPEGYIINTKKHWERIEKAIVPLLDEIGCLDSTVQQTLGEFL